MREILPYGLGITPLATQPELLLAFHMIIAPLLCEHHSIIEDTGRYLGIELDDAIEIAELIDISSIDTLRQVADMVGGARCVAVLGDPDVGLWDLV